MPAPSNHQEKSLRPQDGGIFSTTRWTMVSMARELNGADRMQALENLCRIYRPAIYAFLRGKGQSVEDAEDLTQQFFLQLLTKNTLAHAETSRGKFRTFLLTCVSNFVHNEFQRTRTLKRGGGMTFQHIHDIEPASADPGPDQKFDRKWAETVIDHALTRLEEEWTRRKRPFHELKCYLVESRGQTPMSVKAAALGISEPALKSAVYRLRQRYGSLVRQILAETISPNDSVEEELEWLLSTLAR